MIWCLRPLLLLPNRREGLAWPESTQGLVPAANDGIVLNSVLRNENRGCARTSAAPSHFSAEGPTRYISALTPIDDKFGPKVDLCKATGSWIHRGSLKLPPSLHSPPSHATQASPDPPPRNGGLVGLRGAATPGRAPPGPLSGPL